MEQLYFIAIIPPEPIYSEVLEVKHYFANQHGSKAALKSPPHITLHMPFKLKADKANLLLSELQVLAESQSLFELQLTNYNHFGERVIYVKVEKNETLNQLYLGVRQLMKTKFQQFNADYKNRGYHPHMTVAFRDLKKSAFQQAWQEFESKKYERLLTVRDICLLKHNGKFWEEFKRFEFTQS